MCKRSPAIIKPKDVNDLLKQITKVVLEQAMQAAMTERLGDEKHGPTGRNSGNSRNGVTGKTRKGDFGEVDWETPRNRNGEFEPCIIKKRQRRRSGCDGSVYARSMSTRAS